MKKGQPIFPRLDVEEEVAYIQAKMGGAPVEEENTDWNPEEVELSSEKESIKYDDFDKIELKVAEVIECGPVEGADKLLQFRLDAGDVWRSPSKSFLVSQNGIQIQVFSLERKLSSLRT